jgi:hypothetical protein
MADTGSTGPSRDRLATAFWDVFEIAAPVLLVVAVSLGAVGVPFAALTYVHRGDPAFEDWLRRGLLLVGAGVAARTLMDIVVELCEDLFDQVLERIAGEPGVSVSFSTSRRNPRPGSGGVRQPFGGACPLSSAAQLTGSSTIGAVVDGGFTDLNAALEELARIGCRQPQETTGAASVS